MIQHLVIKTYKYLSHHMRLHTRHETPTGTIEHTHHYSVYKSQGTFNNMLMIRNTCIVNMQNKTYLKHFFLGPILYIILFMYMYFIATFVFTKYRIRRFCTFVLKNFCFWFIYLMSNHSLFFIKINVKLYIC